MLSQTCEYAIRAATYIAQHSDEEPVLAKDIAAEAEVPLRYLQKILRDLVRGGVLVSTRGIGGGFRLSRPAAQLHLADVMSPFDDSLHRSTCPFGHAECGKPSYCPVHDRWSQVVEAYRTFHESTTLADIAEDTSHAARRTRRRKR